MLATSIASIFILASLTRADDPPILSVVGTKPVSWFHHTPTAAPTQDAQVGPGGHFACTDANFTGTCNYYLEPRAECHNYPVELWGKYTSIGPDKGQVCWFFEGEQCLGSKVELKHPGTKNLRGLRYDNRVSSWNCWSRE